MMISEKSLACVLMRLWIGGHALAAGLDKFAAPRKIVSEDVETGEMSVRVVREYAFSNYIGVPEKDFAVFLGDPFLPDWILHAFYYAIGPALILFGAMAILGIATRTTLFALGLIFVALECGLTILSPASAGTLGIQLAIIAAAIVLAPHNRFCITKKF